MLIGPKKRLVEGDTVPLTLTFSDGTMIKVDAMVCKRNQAIQRGGLNSLLKTYL